MKKMPLLDLHPIVQDCKIIVSVGEATDSKCSGVITIVIVGAIGTNPKILTKDVKDLGRTIQVVSFEDTPNTGKIHPVISTLVLESGESRKDNEMIKFCSPN
jgi:hypothetical protein